MSDDAATIKESDPTQLWKTLGIEDRTLDDGRTLTMRPEVVKQDRTHESLLQCLPRLLEQGADETMPELEVKGILGEGGMGRVELAEQLSIGREVAVKKLRDPKASAAAKTALLREGWTTGVLEHPNITPIYTLGRDEDGSPVIVMKKITGTSWLDILEDPERAPDIFDADSPLDLHVEILIQVCDAVSYAHSRGIVHRDLKPENVMLGEFGEVYVVDWGIAVSVERDETGRMAWAGDVSAPAGTPVYMAPEMVEPEEAEIGPHTDVFLLGAVLHEILTGQPPYMAATSYAVMIKALRCEEPTFDDDAPPGLAEICRRAMARDPGDRFDSVRGLRDELHEWERRRESRRLSSLGHSRLQELEELIDGASDGGDSDERRLHNAFSECRFAFEQALEVAPENERATEGLQTALEVMASRELEREAERAAALLIAEFPHPSESFEKRLEQLRKRLDSRREDREKLQQISRDVDPEVGRKSRVLFMLVLGGFWLCFNGVLLFLLQREIVELTHGGMFGIMFGVSAALAVYIYIGRHRFFDNQFNRRVIYSLLAIFVCVTIFRGIVWSSEVALATAVSLEFVFYLMASAIFAIAFDRRLGSVAALCGVAALITAVWPASYAIVLSAVSILATFAIVWIWWDR